MRRVIGLFVLVSMCAPAWAGPEIWMAEQVALTRRDTGTFYLAGGIQGYGELQFLLDTGSSYTVIGEGILKQLQAGGHARLSREVQGRMADGRPRVVPLYRINALRLGDNCWVHGVEAAVLGGDTRPILGMDVLARLAPFTFSTEPPRLDLNRCRAQAPAALAEASPGVTIP
jgi:predicted aspartyl protease